MELGVVRKQFMASTRERPAVQNERRWRTLAQTIWQCGPRK